MKFRISDNFIKRISYFIIAITVMLLPLSTAVGTILSSIITTTSTGLVTDYLDFAYADNDYIVTGSFLDGFSFIRTSDLNIPKGNVYNYRGRPGTTATNKLGLQGFTKRETDGKIYAWYGSDIVDVVARNIVYSNAPDYTHGGYECGPKDRFLADNAGNFLIGSENLDANGDSGGDNGLYKISADFLGKTTLLSDAVWNIFKDSSGMIWISTNNGVYQYNQSGNLTRVYNSQSIKWAEQIFEYNGTIYAVMKNFFHNPNNTPTRQFELYQWNGSAFIKACDIISSGFFSSIQAFSYAGELYTKAHGSSRLLLFNSMTMSFSQVDDIGSTVGASQQIAVSRTSGSSALVSVGNTAGVAIFNWNGDNQTRRITSFNTAEALISDNIHSLYVSQDNTKLYIGPERTEGINIFTTGLFSIYEFPFQETNTSGFFEFNGKLYVQGTSNLYHLNSGQLTTVKAFPTNGEKTYFDKSGYLWAFPNTNSSTGYGGIGMLKLSDLSVKATTNGNGNIYWSGADLWSLDRGYHFYDVTSIPGENAAFIAVGDSEIASSYEKMPFVLKYNYTTNTFSRVALPDTDCSGIRAFASDGTTVYGIASKRLYRYINGAWEFYCPIKLGYFTGAAIAENYLFITSGWNGGADGPSGGFELVNLKTKLSAHYGSAVNLLPTDAIFSVAIQQTGTHVYRVWFGTFKGLAYCDLTIPERYYLTTGGTTGQTPTGSTGSSGSTF